LPWDYFLIYYYTSIQKKSRKIFKKIFDKFTYIVYIYNCISKELKVEKQNSNPRGKNKTVTLRDFLYKGEVKNNSNER